MEPDEATQPLTSPASLSPFCITLLYHPSVSHYYITLLYHPTVSPFCITLLYHPTVSPFCITFLYHLSVSPYCSTLLYHLSIPPYCITLLYHPTVSPYCITLLAKSRFEKYRFAEDEALRLRQIRETKLISLHLWNLDAGLNATRCMKVGEYSYALYVTLFCLACA
jgi:hypothetical protein